MSAGTLNVIKPRVVVHLPIEHSRQHQVNCVYLDYSEALDRVCHSHMTAKIAVYGIKDHILSKLLFDTTILEWW